MNFLLFSPFSKTSFFFCWALLCVSGLFWGLDFFFIIVSLGISSTVLYILSFWGETVIPAEQVSDLEEHNNLI